MKRYDRKSARIIIWVLSVTIAVSMACSFVAYLSPPPAPASVATPTPTLTPTAAPLP
ncbi:MAG: hypothetical protein ACOX3S_10385 [Anaerolineae bacterium]|jgi:multidrug efflux pump subunit AcrA (membrane-fusion protein)